MTRLVEAYHWSKDHHREFVAPLLGSEERLKQMYSHWIAEFLEAIGGNVCNDGLLVLKHPAMVRQLGSLLELVPHVQPVVMVRDPRDQVASELEVAARAGRRDRAVDVLAATLSSWFAGLNPNGLTFVRYEDLVGDYSGVKRRLEDSLDLHLRFDPTQPWPDIERLEAMRKYPSWSPKYGMPMDKSGAGRAAADLDREDIATIEHLCADYMQQFGYRRDEY